MGKYKVCSKCLRDNTETTFAEKSNSLCQECAKKVGKKNKENRGNYPKRTRPHLTGNTLN